MELQESKFLIGIDEAGVGSIAGPLTISAVMINKDKLEHLKTLGFGDSKALSESKRESLFDYIQQQTDEIYYSVISLESYTIDHWGITTAKIFGWQVALIRLMQGKNLKYDNIKVIIDGNIPITTLPKLNQEAIVKADTFIIECSIASIIAKVNHDKIMLAKHLKYPLYNWANNKGYATSEHIHAILEHGPAVGFHRSTFLPNTINNYLAKYPHLLKNPNFLDTYTTKCLNSILLGDMNYF